MLDKLKALTVDFVGDVIRAGGEIATDELIKERRKICGQCEFAGIVEPLPLLKVKGCTQCGCPFATKLKALTNFDIEKKRIVKTFCPHPSGDQWANINYTK